MKHILIISLMALSIWSCSKDPIVDGLDNRTGYDPSKIMCFFTNSETRGTPITDQSQLTDIGVFGYYTGQNSWTTNSLPNRMFNEKLERNGSAWIYVNSPVQWNSSSANDKFTFFAYSPYGAGVWDETTNPNGNGIVVNGNNSTTGVPRLSYTVPMDVTKQPDLMVAVPRKDIIKPTSGFVSLQLEHALTAIGFQIAGNGEKVKGISISGVSMTGTLAVDGGTITWSNLGSANTTTDFSASINFDPDEDYYTTTTTMTMNLMQGNGYLMMIPQTLGTDAKLTVVYEDDTTLGISLDTHEWLPGKKITYALTIIPGSLLLEVTPPSSTYTYKGGTPSFSITSTYTPHNGTAEAVAWITEYSVDGGSNWSTTAPDWLTGFPAGDVGGAEVDYSGVIAPQPKITTNTEELALQAANILGNADSPVDLSGGGETANCYVVNAPGYYSLPLVYGNARNSSGTPNTSAYNPTPASYKLAPFQRHDGAGITDPYIYNQFDLTDADATLVWMDYPDLITNVRLDASKQNLQFDVEQATIAQGNAIVAVRDGSGTILWSWHIWVTAKTIFNASSPNVVPTLNYEGVTYNFMEYNLGWCTARTITYDSTPRIVQVRISQTGVSNPKSETFTLTQNIGPATTTLGGNSPYWQWGRKDPMRPGDGINVYEKPVYGPYTHVLISGSATPAESIKNPNAFYYGSSSRNWCSEIYQNLWSAENINISPNDDPVIKTVYDPSPVGFTVPASNAWTGFTSTGGNVTNAPSQYNVSGSYNEGWSFYTGGWQTGGTSFYPATGYRDAATGNYLAVSGGETIPSGFYWSVTPISDRYAYYLIFRPGAVLPNYRSAGRGAGFHVRSVLHSD